MPRIFSLMLRRVKSLLVLSLLLAGVAQAGTVFVPEPLQPWQDWVLHKHPHAGCPLPIAAAGAPQCAWPGQLSLAVTAQGAQFSQQWQVYRETWVELPGDAQHWPQQVLVNGRAEAVLARDGRPAVRLGAGSYTVSGQLPWAQPPQYLQLPAATALLALTRDGERVAHPNLMAGGQLWLAAPGASERANERDQLQLRVFTKLSDGVPMTMRRVLRLDVSGSERELKLSRALLAGTELMQLHSELPARIEQDGMLRVQARAGSWEIALDARVNGDTREFRIEPQGDDWPAQEIWSFEAAPDVRGVKLSGAAGVDTSQVDVPADWAQLPTWLLEKDTVLTLEQQYRGDTKPRANALTLERNLWLDFDGDGFTVGDRISGSLYRGWRLTAEPTLQLGRVSVNEQPQLVTQLPGEAGAGVEIRQREGLNLYAVSRQGDARAFPAVGWREDVDALNATLYLPPGWRLWHAGGVDRVTQSFVSRWDLWDIFLVMITVVAIFRLLGKLPAVIALLVFGLSFHQSAALLWLSLPVLALLALRQWVEAAAWRRRLNIWTGIFALLFAAAFVDYAVYLVRVSIYPQLEQAAGFGDSIGLGGRYDDEAAAGATADVAVQAPAPATMEMAADGAAELSRSTSMRALQSAPAKMALRAEPTYDSSAVIQTGPGEPNWRWQQVQLGWSGPVTADQHIALYLSGPWLTRLINFAQLLLWGVLIFVLVNGRAPVTRAANTAALVVLAGALMLPAHDARAADFPPDSLLNELEQRLTAPAECMPDCASINEGRLELNDERVTLRLRIDTQATVQVPLPGGYQGFLPQQVLVDGGSDVAVAHDAQGGLHIALEAGRHDVVLSGVVASDRFSLAFAVPVRRFSVTQDGSWSVAGVQDAVLTNNVVELRRAPRASAAGAAQLKPDPVAPFVRIERRFSFGHEWQLHTQVWRVAPQDVAISLRVPLLAGEALTAGDYKVAADNSIEVTIAAGESVAQWSSKLAATSPLALTSPQQGSYVERWLLQASPQWHLAWQGLAPVKSDELQFLPWPGETLALDVTRPGAVSGAQQTVESAQLDSRPGSRSGRHELTLSVRASQAGDYRVLLPEGARVEKIVADGAVLNTEDDRQVLLPLRPGLQTLQVAWSDAQPLGLRWQTPALTLAGPATNINLTLNLPHDRWLLWTNGPAMGPALLYWGVLLVIVAIAVVLGKVCTHYPNTPPLKVHHWILLGLGMSTANSAGSIVVVVWLFALALRARFAASWPQLRFNAVQVMLILLSIVALLTLLSTIPMSLLSSPDMQVQGNGSSSFYLQWFADRAGELLPQASVVSVPMWVYRLVMLVWSLWLAAQLLHWLRWGWECLTAGGFWREAPKSVAPDASKTQ